ncbi:MAG: hypothetical protein PF517_12015 [Salinivirgaceae bacterium]|jgi:hypothetical protein|nr:hypothetical protein [Salinivirgaceae bacterium]
MIKTRNNSSFGVVLLLGILLSFSFFHQINDSVSAIKYTTENNLTTDILAEDCEIFEEEQMTIKTHLSCFFETIIQPVCFEPTSPFSIFHFTIWQPPKIC